ncbi:LamG-like jellyroll fold domain-containing protein [Mariniflexile sp. AS56]|uniref:LamG-like jellyroll fold domain-containing protein n=1 Tax=Mariniflexile sp. AS56 TaxID=3063957 RepID=UPI0026EE3D02|nr:LamG-like jellyroll fold domain-containing protein [Mariniflexile sp. AS56]MDO7171063.1 LamG-like jellyroll fold domain-containing protein [Mariniflexile sp. AS56]
MKTKLLIVFAVLLTCNFSLAQNSNVEVIVNWTEKSYNYKVEVYNDSDVLLATICDVTQCYIDVGKTKPSVENYSTTLDLGCLPNDSKYYVLLYDIKKKGWDNGSIIIKVDGVEVLNEDGDKATEKGKNIKFKVEGTGTACNLPPDVDSDGDGIFDRVDLDDDNDGILDTDENSILSYGGFENIPNTINGNNQAAQGVNATTILPWILIPGSLGSGGTPNVVKVNGGTYNYGNGGPAFDANPNTNTVGFSQHYLDTNGTADVYQSFKINTTTDITYSGYFSPRDNNNTATAKITIYSGIGNNLSGATLVATTGTIAIPIQNGASAATPWKLVQGTVTLSPGTYSYVVSMSDYSNFDEGTVTVTNSSVDTDGDGIPNSLDLDSDNDGIFDAVEAGHGKAHTNGVVNGGLGTDGIPNAVQASANSGTVNYVIQESLDDADYILNYLDLDSDGDGIPDNIEAQTTVGYIAPSGVVNAWGVDTNYTSGLVPVNTDGTDNPDYLDLDSDNEGGNDTTEAGLTLSGNDTDHDGLDDSVDTTTGYLDVNGTINNPSTLPDADSDVNSGGDVDFRDAVTTLLNVPSNAMINFDGVDDYLSGSSFIKGLNEVTIMAWVKSDAGNSIDMTIAGEDVGCRLWLKKGNKPMFSIKAGLTGEKKIGGCSDCEINFDEWHHVAGTYSKSTGLIKLYIDGSLVDSYYLLLGSSISLNSNANNTFEIGRFSNKSTNEEYFKGAIDEVRVFNKALTDSQLQQMVYQEIENSNDYVRGTVLAKDIIDNTTKTKVSWANLIAYYPMTGITSNKTLDYSNNSYDLTLNNIGSIVEQTAPMPYITGFDGVWESDNIWLHGDVWDVNTVVNGKDNAVFRISNNITTNNSIKSLGLIIDENKTLTVNGDHEINNTWLLGLNGTLDLMDDSQLLQTSTSDLVTSANGKILRRQEGTSNAFRYNYWASPVGAKAATSFVDNNGSTKNPNNTAFTLNMLKDETGFDMAFTSSYNQAGKISTYWLYTFKNGVTYWDWSSVKPTTEIESGVGYTQKGTGTGSTQQQYIFEGKPNNGTIVIKATDKGGAGSVANVSKTTYLLGNPYPSALDIYKFIDDNKAVIGGTVQMWQQWDGNSHYLDEYKGGYAYVNKLGAIRASQFAGVFGLTLGLADGVLPPTRYFPVGQAFVAEVISSGDIVFKNSQRTFVKETESYGIIGDLIGDILSILKSSGKQSAKSTADTATGDENVMKKIRLEFNSVVGPKTRREVLLGFSEATTDGFDYGYDSENLEENNNDFSLSLDGKNMNMQAYSPITSDKVVPLNFKSSANNSFEIKATELENIGEYQEIYLRDNSTDTYFDLTKGLPYSFTSEQGKFNSRFELVFQSKQQSLGMEEAETFENFIYYQNNSNTLFGKKLNAPIAKLAIVNMRGQQVLEFKNVSQETLNNGLRISNVSSGAYIVWFKTETGHIVTKKIIVN